MFRNSQQPTAVLARHRCSQQSLGSSVNPAVRWEMKRKFWAFSYISFICACCVIDGSPAFSPCYPQKSARRVWLHLKSHITCARADFFPDLWSQYNYLLPNDTCYSAGRVPTCRIFKGSSEYLKQFKPQLHICSLAVIVYECVFPARYAEQR